MAQRGAAAGVIDQVVSGLDSGARPGSLTPVNGSDPPAFLAASHVPPDEERDPAAVCDIVELVPAAELDPGTDPETAGDEEDYSFWVCISSHLHSRCLHKRFGCWRVPKQSDDKYTSLDGVHFHRRCMHCHRGAGPPAKRPKISRTASSASSGSPTSTGSSSSTDP